MRFVWIGLGGAVGSIARYGLALAMADTRFPWATLTVNITGSFALGFIFGFALNRWSSDLVVPLSVGVLGGFTTFSTFAWEALAMSQDGHPGRTAIYVTASLIGGLLAVFVGYLLGRTAN